METLISKGPTNRSLWFITQPVKAIGEEVVSWKRRIESWVTSQSPFVKTNLSVIALFTLTFGSFALAQQVDITPEQASSFEIYQSIRTAEAAVKGSQAVPQEKSILLAGTAFDAADDYIKEVFGTPVPSRLSAAEAAVKQPLTPPLPEEAIDNGAPPVPGADHSNSSLMSSRNLLWPMRIGRVSSRFGVRWGRMHQGTDIAAPYGTPILAAADGKVIFSGWEGGYGQLIVVDHGNGLKTKYGHCSQRLASAGEQVRQGDVIGKVGNSGRSTGPHLHYEVIREGQAKNPEFFTRRR